MEGQVEVFDTQPDAFANPQSTSVEQLSHELVVACHAAEDTQRFFLGKDGWQAFGSFCSHGLEGEIEGHAEDRFIEEDERVEGLILRRCSDSTFYCEVGEESLNLYLAHRSGVFFLAE
jgi:hypothetical protein